jgi:hypothetical protein
MNRSNRYTQIIERVFFEHYREGDLEVSFEREDIVRVARDLQIDLPKNIGDVIYSFRYRGALPETVRKCAPAGQEWIIRPAGRARYCFTARGMTAIVPSPLLAEIKIPDATPGIIGMYALSDEQALLAKVRYNRLVDIFTGVTCYSLQNHLRTTVPGVGQIETDEIYMGVDKRGAHYVFPVQAKSGKDTLSIVQIEQDFALCATKFPQLICCPIAAQFLTDDLIALFAFAAETTGIAVTAEKHYRLVPADGLTVADLDSYRKQPAFD